jgi:hypothetical protein
MMTRITKCLFVACSLAFCSSLLGQGIQLNLNEIFLDLGEDIAVGDVVVTNEGGETVNCVIAIQKLCQNVDDELKIQVEWNLSFAPTNENYTDYGIEALGTILTPGDSNSIFQVIQYDAGTLGSDWRIHFYDLNNPANVTYLDIHIDVCPDEDIIISTQEIDPISSNWLVYPNPAEDQFRLSIQDWEKDLTLVISNNQGETVLSRNNVQLEQSVDISTLNAGIYFVHIGLNDGLGKAKRLIVH